MKQGVGERDKVAVMNDDVNHRQKSGTARSTLFAGRFSEYGFVYAYAIARPIRNEAESETGQRKSAQLRGILKNGTHRASTVQQPVYAFIMRPHRGEGAWPRETHALRVVNYRQDPHRSEKTVNAQTYLLRGQSSRRDARHASN